VYVESFLLIVSNCDHLQIRCLPFCSDLLKVFR